MAYQMKNPVKETLAAGGRAFGTMLTTFAWPGVMEVLAEAGWQFAVIDTEHSLFHHESLENMCRTARNVGIVPVIRPADANYHLLARALDLGAYGVMVPHVDTVEEAKSIALSTHYPPTGERGAGGNVLGLSGQSVADFVRNANQAVLTAIMIESGEAVSRLDELCAVPGIDAYVIGPVDLSLNLGVPGQIDHPKVQEAADKVVHFAEKHRKAAGIHAGNPKDVERFAARGFRWLMCSTDLGMLRTRSSELAAAMKQICATGRPTSDANPTNTSPY